MRGFAARGAGVSEIGRVRETNQDRILLRDRLVGGTALYAVADGLGGHAAGGEASAVAVESLVREVPALLERGLAPSEALALAVRRANADINAQAASPERAGMATTCTAMLVAGPAAILAHVGDSRAYLLRGAEIRQLTTDHSVVAELVRHGTLSPAAAGGHAQRHVLTRALGTEPDVQVDVLAVPLRARDTLLLASDGLHTAVPTDEMAAVIRTTRDAGEACRVLVGLANARGGTDNASAVIVRVRPRWMDRVARVLAAAALAAFIAGGAGAYRLEHAYFLGVTGGRVAVMRGMPARLLGVPLFSVVRVTPVAVGQIAPAYRPRLLQGIPARDPGDAEALLQDLLHRP
ncbi:MAG TPA: PP2C family serine/threonine-protein phosphatase [bacterium]|nr:PP2C family serine/threonine-protein phosphatase [bacterium]